MRIMNPIFTSAAFGFLKGYLMGGRRDPRIHPLHANLAGPLTEEALFRAIPHHLSGGKHSPASTATHFALMHMPQEISSGASGGRVAMRFADVFAGGMLYEAAYRRFGFLGAVLAHAAHNAMCSVGSASRPASRGAKMRRK